MAKAKGALDKVYAAKGADDLAKSYDQWAETYDAEMMQTGYRHPAIGVGLMARYLPAGQGPVLDAGAGTGLTGELLKILGFAPLVALDLSPAMLARAGEKDIYAELHQARLGGRLPFADGQFAGVISTGVFTTGHVGFEAVEELLRILCPGGRLVLTVKDSIWEDGFAEGAERLCREGRLRLLEETPPYVSMPGVPGTAPGRGCAWERV